MHYVKLFLLVLTSSTVLARSSSSSDSSSSSSSSSSSDCSSSSSSSSSDSTPRLRAREAYEIRKHAAKRQTIDQRYVNITHNNGDEKNIPNYAAQFSKLLAHDLITGDLTANGKKAYKQLVKAINSGEQDDYNAINLFVTSGTRRLFANPQSALAFSMEGRDTSLYSVPQVYTLDSKQAAADLIEVYLHVICRDIIFNDYGTGSGTDIDLIHGGSITNNAAAILDSLGSAYQGPRNSSGHVDASVLFRGSSAGDLVGPYISQFLLFDLLPLFDAGCAGPTATMSGVPNLPLTIFSHDQQKPIASLREFGVTWSDFVAIQNGQIPRLYQNQDFDPINLRYLICGRDIGSMVHFDGPYEYYTNALNILAAHAFPISAVFPYRDGDILNEAAMHTMGGSDAFTLVGGVCIEAFKAAWAQKWRANRRLRPEAMGGLLHRWITTGTNTYHLHSSLNNSYLLNWIRTHNSAQALIPWAPISPASLAQTYLLAQMFPEGSPAHPSWPSGHATVAGACVTVIKAIFDDTARFIDHHIVPVKPDPTDPTQLIPLSGEGEDQMTVGSELDKLASNTAMGRNFAGVHYRSDAEGGINLGEQVAIAFLQDHANVYTEQGFTGFELTKRNGTRIRITAKGVTVI